MNVKAPTLDPAFIERQRRYLVDLRESLRAANQTDKDEDAEIEGEDWDGARENEDEAQKLADLELSGNLVVRNLGRLKIVERALAKLADGTYGISDVSGKPIPRARLEAVPEAICTIEEE